MRTKLKGIVRMTDIASRHLPLLIFAGFGLVASAKGAAEYAAGSILQRPAIPAVSPASGHLVLAEQEAIVSHDPYDAIANGVQGLSAMAVLLVLLRHIKDERVARDQLEAARNATEKEVEKIRAEAVAKLNDECHRFQSELSMQYSERFSEANARFEKAMNDATLRVEATARESNECIRENSKAVGAMLDAVNRVTVTASK